MDEIIAILVTMLETPSVPLKIGVMVGTAMLIGYMLYDDTPNLFIRVALSFIVFSVLAEWIRSTIIFYTATQTHPNSMVTAISFVSGILFIVGLFTGMMFARSFRKRMKATEEAANDVLTKISNGDFTKSRINQKTKPIK